ncbi:MAG: transcriptional regulator [Chlorobium sp.]
MLCCKTFDALSCSKKAGTGLRFIRDLEQGKKTLRMDKVNQLLGLFGYELGPVKQERGE